MPLTTPTLHTARLVLRPVREDDVDALFALMSDAELLRYWDSPPWTERAQAERFVTNSAMVAREDRGVRVVVDDGAGRFLGWCLLAEWNPQFRTAELGFCFTREAWGHGYATEAAGALLDWGFEAMDLNRVDGQVDTRNPPSARVLERLGFLHEGTKREDCIVEGVVSDTWIYGLLRRDRTA